MLVIKEILKLHLKRLKVRRHKLVFGGFIKRVWVEGYSTPLKTDKWNISVSLQLSKDRFFQKVAHVLQSIGMDEL